MLISIDFECDEPIYAQLRDQIVIGIASKALRYGEAMPSVRRLAADIGINAHTVNKTYAILRDEGYLVMDRRIGCRVQDAPIAADDAFRDGFSRRLLPFAAEAACRGMTPAEFGALCADTLSGLEEAT